MVKRTIPVSSSPRIRVAESLSAAVAWRWSSHSLAVVRGDVNDVNDDDGGPRSMMI